MKVYLNSIGCRLNQSEMETLGRQILAQGHEIVTDFTAADKVVINTCAVTNNAARDARSQTRRIQRQNRDAEIYLTGCYATIAPEELHRLNGGINVVANKDKSQLIRLVSPHSETADLSFEQEPVMREFLAGSWGNTRAFVKVQDGCNNKCTFCITTVARGRSASRHLGDIVAEVQALSAAGYQEAVITGVHLGAYGRDLGRDIRLSHLVKALLDHTDMPRLRLSSLEPWDIEADFFALWENPRLLPHLHMPLQSGSDRILRLMARRTTRADFRRLVKAAREHIPDLNLSTDIILGFPGETQADFRQSVDYVQEIAFSRLHAFTYSSRPGTAAAKMPDHLPNSEKKERTRKMIALGKKLSLQFHKRYEGEVHPILWESTSGADKDGLRWNGYTPNYIRVTARGAANMANRVAPARIIEANEDGVQGIILNESF